MNYTILYNTIGILYAIIVPAVLMYLYWPLVLKVYSIYGIIAITFYVISFMAYIFICYILISTAIIKYKSTK